MEYKVAVEKLQLYKHTKTAEEKRLAKKSMKKLLENKKKVVIEDDQQNDTFCEGNFQDETKYLSNIPVYNVFGTLKTDATEHVDENLNINEKGDNSMCVEED